MTTIRWSTTQMEELADRQEDRMNRSDLHATTTDSEPLHPVVPGSICADYGCDVVHPSTSHDAYDVRFDHARTCQACRRAGAGHVGTDDPWHDVQVADGKNLRSDPKPDILQVVLQAHDGWRRTARAG